MRSSPGCLLERLLKIMAVFSTLALIVMMLVTVADVSMANFLHRPIVGTFDLVATLLVFAVFLGVPITFRREANIVVDVVDHFASGKTVAKFQLASRILSLLFLLILLYNMLGPALDAYRYGEKKPELGLPLFVIWIPILIGIAVAVWSVVATLLHGRAQSDGASK